MATGGKNTEWAVRCMGSTQFGGVVEVTGAIFEIQNVTSGEIGSFVFGGGGLSVGGIAFASVPIPPTWTHFHTENPVEMKDFEGLAYLSNFSTGLGLNLSLINTIRFHGIAIQQEWWKGDSIDLEGMLSAGTAFPFDASLAAGDLELVSVSTEPSGSSIQEQPNPPATSLEPTLTDGQAAPEAQFPPWTPAEANFTAPSGIEVSTPPVPVEPTEAEETPEDGGPRASAWSASHSRDSLRDNFTPDRRDDGSPMPPQGLRTSRGPGDQTGNVAPHCGGDAGPDDYWGLGDQTDDVAPYSGDDAVPGTYWGLGDQTDDVAPLNPPPAHLGDSPSDGDAEIGTYGGGDSDQR